MICRHTRKYYLWCVLLIGFLIGFAIPGEASQYKVLVVMSYDVDFPWVQEVTEGIESVLADTCEIQYFYMKTKKDLAGGPQRAKEAFGLFQEFQPDGVIASDDNAQSMFVVSYLKDQVDTPVMFCGVNDVPETYGYPASNVSGILERHHLKESLIFARQLVPSINNVAYIIKESPTAQGIYKQIQNEKETYPFHSGDFKTPKTLPEAIQMAEELSKQYDLLFMEEMEGLLDENGQPLQERQVIPALVKAFGKPTTASDAFRLQYGVLCAVVNAGQEQGEVAATMLLEAMQGTPISELPITQNKKGVRMINVDTMRSLGIKPKPHVLQGVKLIITEE